MIDDLYVSGIYWTIFFSAFFLSCYFLKARIFDFNFLISFILSQYVAHSAYSFYQKIPEITIFCFLFMVVFVATYKINVQTVTFNDFTFYRSNLKNIEKYWILGCKAYLIIYFGTKLATTPFLSGELLLDVRLAAQKENRIMFYMGLAILPAISACMYDWINSRFKITLLDGILFFILILGIIGTPSKSAFMPLLLAYFGAASYMRVKTIRGIYLFSIIGIFSLVSYLSLVILFPLLDSQGILNIIGYRVVANTDNLEYLYVLNTDPASFRFTGIGSLIPMISRFFGYVSEYPPGVWLHGMRFGVWDGYGPNAGIVMDYYANLSWFGLLFAAGLAMYLRFFLRLRSAVGCSFASIAYSAVIDITMFDVSFILFSFFLFSLLFFIFILEKIHNSILNLKVDI